MNPSFQLEGAFQSAVPNEDSCEGLRMVHQAPFRLFQQSVLDITRVGLDEEVASSSHSDKAADTFHTLRKPNAENEQSDQSLITKLLIIQSDVTSLVRDVQENHLNYPANRQSSELLRNSLELVKNHLSFARKLAQLAPVCPELEPVGQGTIRGRYRKFSHRQEATLLQVFENTQGTPDSHTIHQIAKEFKVGEERIRKWFSNKRQLKKKTGRSG